MTHNLDTLLCLGRPPYETDRDAKYILNETPIKETDMLWLRFFVTIQDT